MKGHEREKSIQRAEKKLHGLQMVCKRHGKMKIGGTLFIWDYAQNIQRKRMDMTTAEVKANLKLGEKYLAETEII